MYGSKRLVQCALAALQGLLTKFAKQTCISCNTTTAQIRLATADSAARHYQPINSAASGLPVPTLIRSSVMFCSTTPRLPSGLCVLTNTTSLPAASADRPWSSSLMRSAIRLLGPQPSTNTLSMPSSTWQPDLHTPLI
eukprot:GHRR01034780.1.p1 GENE.GHRR01034780.1~~GHRR01034780.1.p1  ORF type:complete len:138 (+),score=34.14 GHRR01034780.1:732-1145(+)